MSAGCSVLLEHLSPTRLSHAQNRDSRLLRSSRFSQCQLYSVSRSSSEPRRSRSVVTHDSLSGAGDVSRRMLVSSNEIEPHQDIDSNNISDGLERDYYGCFCLKFIVRNGTHVSEERVLKDFGQFGEVVDIRGPGLFSGLRGNHVYVRFIDKSEAEEALRQLGGSRHALNNVYHQLSPASISDVLPDNYGLYTISFYNKTGIPSGEVRREFSNFGEVKNLTGSLDVKGGRVFVSYKEKNSAVQALQAFFFRKDRYPNMKFALPRCEKDYFGCYCLKFYNKSGKITEEHVMEEFGQFGVVVDVRGPGLFDVSGDDVYVRYKEKSSAEQALVELVGKYDSLCLAPPSDIQADKFGYFTITFVNDKCLSKSDAWYIFSKYGTVACVNGTFDCKKGRVFVSYKDKQGALSALETMLVTKDYHLQVSKNSTVRKNEFSLTPSALSGSSSGGGDIKEEMTSPLRHPQHRSKSSHGEVSPMPLTPYSTPRFRQKDGDEWHREEDVSDNRSNCIGGSKHMVRFNRNVEKDIFGYYCLSFLNEDGDISEKKVKNDFGKFGDVVSVRGALGKQKGHVFVRFSQKGAAETCLNCLNSFPLSEMSKLFGKYLFLSPATPRDIDCDMHGFYTISFLNLNAKTIPEIHSVFSKYGEIPRICTGSGGGTNSDELVSISFYDKFAAIKSLQTHFLDKDFPYLDIAKGSSLLLVNSSSECSSDDNEDDISQPIIRDPFHDDSQNGLNGGPDVVDALLKPFQSYFNIYLTGQYPSSTECDEIPSGLPALQSVSFSEPMQMEELSLNVGTPDIFSPPSSSTVQSKISPVSNTSGPEQRTVGCVTRQQSRMQLNNSQPPQRRHLFLEKKTSSRNLTHDEGRNGGVKPSTASVNKLKPSTSSLSTTILKTPSLPSHMIFPNSLVADVFGTFSICYMKQVPSSSGCNNTNVERKIRSDFGRFGSIRFVRWISVAEDFLVVISYTDLFSAQTALKDDHLKQRYQLLTIAPVIDICADNDGLYSVEFVNSGMNGIREIKNEFSVYGEVIKVVQSGGAKNSVKRVAVSFVNQEAAVQAVKSHSNSKDFENIDMVKECLKERTKRKSFRIKNMSNEV